MEYLKDHAPISPAVFEIHWKALSKETLKYWADTSKARKTAVLSPNDGIEAETA